jgi:hypothetical protein
MTDNSGKLPNQFRVTPNSGEWRAATAERDFVKGFELEKAKVELGALNATTADGWLEKERKLTEIAQVRQDSTSKAETAFWNLSQTLAWVLTRDENFVAFVSDHERTHLWLEVAAARYSDEGGSLAVQCVEAAAEELLKQLSVPNLSCLGRRNGKGRSERIHEADWTMFHFEDAPNRAIYRGGNDGWHDLRFPTSEVVATWRPIVRQSIETRTQTGYRSPWMIVSR